MTRPGTTSYFIDEPDERGDWELAIQQAVLYGPANAVEEAFRRRPDPAWVAQLWAAKRGWWQNPIDQIQANREGDRGLAKLDALLAHHPAAATPALREMVQAASKKGLSVALERLWERWPEHERTATEEGLIAQAALLNDSLRLQELVRPSDHPVGRMNGVERLDWLLSHGVAANGVGLPHDLVGAPPLEQLSQRHTIYPSPTARLATIQACGVLLAHGAQLPSPQALTMVLAFMDAEPWTSAWAPTLARDARAMAWIDQGWVAAEGRVGANACKQARLEHRWTPPSPSPHARPRL